MTLSKFEVGAVYVGHFLTDYDVTYSRTVVRRTAKVVWLEDSMGKVTRRHVTEYNGSEQCSPFGRYSMSPILSATDRRPPLADPSDVADDPLDDFNYVGARCHY